MSQIYQVVYTHTDDFHTAFVNWVGYHRHNGTAGLKDAHDSFCEFLGVPYLPATGTVKLTDEQTRRVKLLAGPHWMTVIKAYYAKKD